jgi:hypothetical protein
MKRSIVLVALLASSAAYADDLSVTAAPPPRLVGVDGVGVVPVGDYANAVRVGLGALLRLEFPAGQGYVTARGGAIFHAMQDGVNAQLTLAPIYGGYRMPVGTSGAYLAGELGITLAFATASQTINGMTISASDSKLGITLMGGLRRGTLDLRGGLFLPDVNHAAGFMFSAGWDFAQF